MSEPAPRRLSLEEFFVWDDGTPTRYELVDGERMAMAPISAVHSVVCGALSLSIGNQLKPPCRLLPQGAVVPADRPDTWFEAGVMVAYGPVTTSRRWPDGPVLVAEILSPSTLIYDRVAKLDAYRRVGSIRDILLVWCTVRRVEHWSRRDDEWKVHDLIGRGTVMLDTLGVTIDLAAIYEGIGGLE